MQSREKPTVVRYSRDGKLEAAGHIASTVSKQGEVGALINALCALLALLYTDQAPVQGVNASIHNKDKVVPQQLM